MTYIYTRSLIFFSFPPIYINPLSHSHHTIHCSHLTIIWKWGLDRVCYVDIWDRSSTYGTKLNGSPIKAEE